MDFWFLESTTIFTILRNHLLLHNYICKKNWAYLCFYFSQKFEFSNSMMDLVMVDFTLVWWFISLQGKDPCQVLLRDILVLKLFCVHVNERFLFFQVHILFCLGQWITGGNGKVINHGLGWLTQNSHTLWSFPPIADRLKWIFLTFWIPIKEIRVYLSF